MECCKIIDFMESILWIYIYSMDYWQATASQLTFKVTITIAAITNAAALKTFLLVEASAYLLWLYAANWNVLR